MRPDIGAIIAHPKWDIAHQSNSAGFRVRFNSAPLLKGNPLHVSEVTEAFSEMLTPTQRQLLKPLPRGGQGTMFLGPAVPAFAPVPLHQRPKKDVFVEPRCFRVCKGGESF